MLKSTILFAVALVVMAASSSHAMPSIMSEHDSEYFNLYKSHSVYRLYPETEQHLELLNEILPAKFARMYDFWTDLRALNTWVDIMLKPEFREQFLALADAYKLKYTLNIEDVGSQIHQQLKLNSEPSPSNDFDYSKYHRLDDIVHWMHDMEAQFPKYATVFNVSRSYQKRDIFAMRISVPSAKETSDPHWPEAPRKKALWFDGGIHAREWISPATVIYMGYTLLSQYGNDSDVTKLLNTFDVFILPVFNVDGYEYTWAKDRMWRKTRSKTHIPTCFGADPNRNWDSHFCENGASRDPCDDTYCGESAFSESEVRGVAEFLGKNNDTIVLYINFHSYSQLWMSPYGYSSKLPKDFKAQDGGSEAAVYALSKLYGTKFEHGSIATTIYVASGNSADWTYDTANIPYTYGVELRDQGEYGFLLPPEQIIPSGVETFAGVKALAFYIKDKMSL